MDTKDFCYWLQGFFELTDSKNLTEQQIKVIKEHLQTVFTKVTKEIVKEQPNLLKEETIKEIVEMLKTQKSEYPIYPKPYEWYVEPGTPNDFKITCDTKLYCNTDKDLVSNNITKTINNDSSVVNNKRVC